MKIHISITTEKGETFEGDADLVKSKSKPAHTVIKKSGKNKGPSEIIKFLHKEGFFSAEKKLSDLENEFKSKGYNFGKSSLLMALDRADFLKKSGSKGNYQFIQKYPAE